MTTIVTIDAHVLPWQARVMREAARFNVVAVGRRAGKSALAHLLTARTATTGQPSAYLAPTYRMMTDAWHTLRDNLAQVCTRASVTERRLDLAGGGSIELWSMEHADAVRGRRYARLVVDEAAHISGLGTAWPAILRPTLADLSGDAWFLSTPNGLNAFWQLYQLGQSSGEPDWRSWRMPSSVGTLAAAEIAAMKQGMPPRTFAQEVEAVFQETAGAVFRGVYEAATAQPQDGPAEGHQYVIGVDWGRAVDYTVAAVIDVTDSRMVAMDRSGGVSYVLQRERLADLCRTWHPVTVVAEANAMGEPIIEELARANLPVTPFTTTNATKAVIIDGLSLALERGTIAILDDETLTGELVAFTETALPSGLRRYAAPEGMHDDCVMALALAWWAADAGRIEAVSL